MAEWVTWHWTLLSLAGTCVLSGLSNCFCFTRKPLSRLPSVCVHPSFWFLPDSCCHVPSLAFSCDLGALTSCLPSYSLRHWMWLDKFNSLPPAAMGIFIGGLGGKWKVGLALTEAVGRGMVRWRFLWASATTVFMPPQMTQFWYGCFCNNH